MQFGDDPDISDVDRDIAHTAGTDSGFLLNMPQVLAWLQATGRQCQTYMKLYRSMETVSEEDTPTSRCDAGCMSLE